MEQTNTISRILLFALEGVGAVFVGVFLAAYLGGMFMNPSTTVLHNLPEFRIPLMFLGALLLILVLAVVIISRTARRK